MLPDISSKKWAKNRQSWKYRQNSTNCEFEKESKIIFDCENNEILLGNFKTLWKEKYVLWVCGVQQAKLKEAVLCIRVWKGSHEMHEWAANQSCSIELYSRYMYRLQEGSFPMYYKIKTWPHFSHSTYKNRYTGKVSCLVLVDLKTAF